MLKKIFSIALVCFFVQQASAKDLPDFTELVEKQGAAVVNISTTQTVHDTQIMPGLPNLPKGDPFYEFFKRFAPQQAPQESRVTVSWLRFHYQCGWLHLD